MKCNRDQTTGCMSNLEFVQSPDSFAYHVLVTSKLEQSFLFSVGTLSNSIVQRNRSMKSACLHPYTVTFRQKRFSLRFLLSSVVSVLCVPRKINIDLDILKLKVSYFPVFISSRKNTAQRASRSTTRHVVLSVLAFNCSPAQFRMFFCFGELSHEYLCRSKKKHKQWRLWTKSESDMMIVVLG